MTKHHATATARHALLAVPLLLATTSAQAAEPARRVTLDEAIQIAVENNQELERADAKVDEAAAARKKMRGRFGPMLMGEAGIQHWDKAQEIEFAMPTDGLPISIPPIAMEVQEQTTMQASLTLAQPITGLWAIYEGYEAMAAGEQAAELERDAASHSVDKKVADAYFMALTAERMEQIAALSVEQVTAHVKRAQALERAEMIAKNKVLEAEVRLAEIRSMHIQAQGGVTLSRSNLAFQMGLPAGEPIGPAPVAATELRAVHGPYAEAAAQAVENRPDLLAVQARIKQAEAGYYAAWAQMLPQVNVIASAMFAKGSSFQQEQSYFIGATASWTLWEWGATYYGIDEAEARVRQARSGEAQMREGVKLEVRKARIEVDTAKKKVEVMRKAVTQAEENLRVTQRLFEEDAGVSTDVLDAQALLARAQANEATATFDYLKARAELRRALGQTPVARSDRRGGGR